MIKRILQKNIQIVMALVLLICIFIVYKYSSLNLKAANSYSCNYYIGRCFVDNTYGKSNNFDTCNKECFNKRFKYYFNKTANVCTRDFRGSYNTKQECEDQNQKNFQYLCNYRTGKCNIIGDTINYAMHIGIDYDTCQKNCRPLYRAYECDKENMRCNLVAKSDDNAKLTYESCWTYCMGQPINNLPVETLYQCSISGACVPNPSGTFKSYDECYNNTTCKANRIIYQEKTNIRYTWDTSSQKCVKNAQGEFESWGECRAVKDGIGSGYVYVCNNTCSTKLLSDFGTTEYISSSGCYGGDCMTKGGAITRYIPAELECDVNDRCYVNQSQYNIIYLTQSACNKYCGKEEADKTDKKDSKPNINNQNSMCISNHWLDVGQDFCNNDSECGTINNVCRNKKNLPNDNGYDYVLKSVCDSNGLPFADLSHTCKCVYNTCTETSSLYPKLLSSMVCGDGQCLEIENKAWLYWFMKKDINGKYQLVTPEYNKYYCAKDCVK